jgi:predicted nucleic acid-binding protein
VALIAAPEGPATLLLVDKSAWVRGLESAPADAELCLSDITRLEILCSARSAAEYVELEQLLDAFRTLASNAETWAIAATAQRELAATGQHRVALPDLLVAACAQQHAADVLHVDRHFTVLEGVVAFRAVRLT